MAPDTALLLLRGLPLRRYPQVLCAAALPRGHASGLSTYDELRPPTPAAVAAANGISQSPPAPSPPPPSSWEEHSEYRKWKDKEEDILSDIEPITILTKEILHSNRFDLPELPFFLAQISGRCVDRLYKDGARLSEEEEKAVIKNLLTYHPRSQDKIGCGLDYIMVDRHPQFRNSRCLFVVRTDGVWIDFSYQKCLRAYIRGRYPSHAERFIRQHFKRS